MRWIDSRLPAGFPTGPVQRVEPGWSPDFEMVPNIGRLKLSVYVFLVSTIQK